MKTHQNTYEEKQTAAGFTRMAVWIPVEDKEALSNYARKRRAQHTNQLKREQECKPKT